MRVNDPASNTTLSVNGRRVEYRSIAGDQRLPILVLLHEGLGCVALWRDFPERLAEATGQEVFLYSRPGYGSSDPITLPRPLDYMSRAARDDLPQVLGCLGRARYTLVGHSDGASIALVYAGELRDPGLVSLILLAPHVIAETVGRAAIAKLNEQYATGDLRQRLAKYHGANTDCAFRGWADSWLHPDFATWSIEAALGGIEVPVLQIQGSGDEYGSREQLTRIEQGASGPVETVLIESCGHAPHLEHAITTVKIIASFCRRVQTSMD